MCKPLLLLLSVICVLPLSVNSVWAQCRKDPREVHFNDESGRDVVVKLSVYVCPLRESDQEAHIGVEFYRIGNQAASMIVSGGGYPNLLDIFGPFRMQETSVLDKFRYLVEHFSSSKYVDNAYMHINSGILRGAKYEFNNSFYFHSGNVSPEVGIVDYFVGSDPEAEWGAVYPAIKDIRQLDQHTIPANMSVFYEKAEKDENEVRAVYWRYGTLQDVIDYPDNITAWNLAARANKGLDPSEFVQEDKFPWKEDYHKLLGLLLTLTEGRELPKGYLILSGRFSKERCGEPTWEFHIDSPAIALEVMLVRNTSNRTIRLDRLVGSEFGEARLRLADEPSPPSITGASSISVGSLILPGHSLLIPTRILLELRYMPPTNEASITGAEVYERLISKGISARPDVYARPIAPDFAFGPQLDISGITVDGNEIKFSANSTNIMDVSFAWGLGSCPYLASWDEQRKQWLEYGKVLHPADGQRRESAQSVVLPGFVSRFRLEEREPEVTTLDRAELFLTLRDGKQVAARPTDAHGRDMSPFHVFWDEAQEFAFALPQGVSAGDITQSRLVLTGYYQRYSSLPNFSLGKGAAYLRAAFPSKPSH